MRKEDTLNTLTKIENSLTKLKKDISAEGDHVNKKGIKDSTLSLCKNWFEETELSLQRFSITDSMREKYHCLFTNLIKLALKKSRKMTYLKIIDDVLLNFKDELYIPVMKYSGNIISVSHLTKILEDATEQEKDYLNEALGCASHNFFRASIVLGWDAAAYRMHKVIEKLGFDEFNKKSEEMKNIDEGRFKRFKKSFHVQTLSDLSATVFDTDLLWVLEYWGIIDSNQHERLSICFTMRNNSAHPGEASISEENLSSFYSDLKIIIFANPKFKL